MRVRLKLAWMWQGDIYEDMWNHGCLVGVIGGTAKGLPDQTSPPPWDEDTPAYDLIYLYVGFGLFYVRLMVDWRAKPHPNLYAPPEDD